MKTLMFLLLVNTPYYEWYSERSQQCAEIAERKVQSYILKNPSQSYAQIMWLCYVGGEGLPACYPYRENFNRIRDLEFKNCLYSEEV